MSITAILQESFEIDEPMEAVEAFYAILVVPDTYAADERLVEG